MLPFFTFVVLVCSCLYRVCLFTCTSLFSEVIHLVLPDMSKKIVRIPPFGSPRKKGPLPGGSSVFSSFSWFQYLCTIVKDKRKTIKRETFIGISSLFCKKEGSYDQRNEIIFILHFSQALKMCIKEYRGRESGNGPWRVWKEKIWYIFSQIII